MSRVLYARGADVQPGDQIRYHGESGNVEFVITEVTGEASKDWFLEDFPGGGVMLTATGFGSVFLSALDIDEDLELIARSDEKRT